jgi:hypothetical protein
MGCENGFCLCPKVSKNQKEKIITLLQRQLQHMFVKWLIKFEDSMAKINKFIIYFLP